MNELKKFKNYYGFQHDEDVVCFSSITSTETFYNALVDICREKLVSYKSFRSNFPLCKFSRSRLEAAIYIYYVYQYKIDGDKFNMRRLLKELTKEKIKEEPKVFDMSNLFYPEEFIKSYQNFVIDLEKVSYEYQNKEKLVNDQIELTDLLIKIVGEKLKYDVLLSVVGKAPNYHLEQDGPFGLYTPGILSEGKSIEKMKINSNSTTILPNCWAKDKYFNALISIKKFVQRHNNHRGTYYKEINLCIIDNGNHSIAAGLINNEVSIEVDTVSIKHLFEKYRFDGKDYFHIDTDEKVMEKYNKYHHSYLIDILYELNRNKYIFEKMLQ